MLVDPVLVDPVLVGEGRSAMSPAPALPVGRSCALLIEQPPFSPTASRRRRSRLRPCERRYQSLAASGLPVPVHDRMCPGAYGAYPATLRTAPRAGHHPGGVIAPRVPG